ncbi:endoribonuclease dicer homolog 2 [Phtheirospermum japonicum]|uniref:Endoribonuclease dicer homolog 2 n=1 Tax=Phtheirospermum japonicum TaxID=374723 RepID=A0A830BRC5_9LAMI|nr:endoribonuclease dicer homolog 2 [Phtheirospermum japonicum]
METINVTQNGGNQQVVADPVPFARSYQLDALEKALKQNTIVFFETGTGKTLIAIMLLRSYAHLIRKPSSHIAVFLVPTVVLVNQQSEVVALHTDLKVGKYYGEMGVDYWDAEIWKDQVELHEVLVMTPQILLNALRHRFLRLDQIKVLIFDECHNARGKHSYACIMTEFYHRELASNNLKLPRVFGMTASPIKAKASSSEADYWKQIKELENLMHSKVTTCDSDSVLSRYVAFSTTKVKTYNQIEIPHMTVKRLEDHLQKLVTKHEQSLDKPSISESVAKSAKKRLNKLFSTFMFCLTELGIWLTLKAAEFHSVEEEAIFLWGKMDVSCERIVRAFSSDAVKIFSASMPSGPQWSIRNDLMANVTAGYLTSKVMCLVEILLDYRKLEELRCIVFVERIVTAIAIRNLLNELLPELIGWKTEYTAGNSSMLQSQSRKEQSAIVDEFRRGKVNIIVATSMLEEGLDVQSCNLVIRFDPSATICSFIQSRGRARMPNSDFVLMVKGDDSSAFARVQKYLASGDIMRRECLSHAHISCEPLANEMHGEKWYEVASTGAIITMSSSVQLLYFYCSRLPSDRYFKPYPYCDINKELEICTLRLPSSCPVQTITVHGKPKCLKQLACLEACKKLHEVGALTDNLIPDMVEEEAEAQGLGNVPCLEEHPKFFPQELVGSHGDESETVFQCYSIVLDPKFEYDVKFQEILLAVREKLDDLKNLDLELDADRGSVIAEIKYVGYVHLDSEQVARCQKFQTTLFRVLLDRNLNKLPENDQDPNNNKIGSPVFSYLLLPVLSSHQGVSIDWNCIDSVRYPANASHHFRTDCRLSKIHTKDGLVCRCMLENSLVCTPHNGFLYCVNGILDGLDGNSTLEVRDGELFTYKKYFEQRHGIKLQYEWQTLFKGKQVFTVHNYLQRCRIASKKGSSLTRDAYMHEPSNSSCELPPELCSIVMSPISISNFYSFSFLPSVMHRIESLLIAANLKNMALDHCMQNDIPTLTVLEAITTKKCQEKIHLESLETLGDSFLKYAVSQHLFKTYQNCHEGVLSIKREKRICNATLCKLGCDRKITGFIRTEPLDIKTWIIPGINCADRILQEEMLSSKKVYVGRPRKIKSKTVADVTEALIGAFLSAGGETAALSFMAWLGIDVEFTSLPYTRNICSNPELHINIKYLESLLKYTFRDVSLLVEALTHGSYMRPEIPGCYQRLEFLGDAVLDYLITVHLYLKYPGLSPGLLTDLRSASVNNDCYALSSIKAELHKHLLHLSPDLHRHIVETVSKFKELNLDTTFGWESESTYPKVLGDIVESLAGAIFVDSGYDKEIVFRSLKPLLEPLITPETLRIHPVRELTELCQREHYKLEKLVVVRRDGLAFATVEVEARGVVYKETRSEADKKIAKKLAYKAVLECLK